MRTPAHFEMHQPLLDKYKETIAALCDRAATQQRPVIIVLEGWSASGKDEVLKCLTEKLDPDRSACHTLDEPQGEEAAHHFLWRYWLRLPPAGQVAIFRGSWYRRVLYDRVAGLCSNKSLKRAFRAIKQFERQNLDFGSILLKFWLHISKNEHTARFDTHRTAEEGNAEIKVKWHDLDNRPLYEQAANEMLLKTSLTNAEWTIVPADSEIYACLHILQTCAFILSSELNFYPTLEAISL